MAALACLRGEASYQGNAVLNRLDASIIDHNRHGQYPYTLSISVGVVPFDPHGGLTFEAAITRADQDMYLQKQNRADGTRSVVRHII